MAATAAARADMLLIVLIGFGLGTEKTSGLTLWRSRKSLDAS
jgi:hypothetical protein